MSNSGTISTPQDWLAQLRGWALELGFSQIGVAGVDLSAAEPGLLAWLAAGFEGDMHYMARHGVLRARPAELVPGTVSVITVRMDYLPRATPADWQAVEWQRQERPAEGWISLYARGRDYHKVLRQRLQVLAIRLEAAVGPLGYRVFTDSAPLLEVELASRSGQGWRGKHTLTLSREAGSVFFLGEILVNMPLPPTAPVAAHCGSCTACINVCPTGAIVAPYRLDARRCISYLTIEHAGPIPLDLRPLVGNRIYGCDDCQLACPWNKFAQPSVVPDFDERAVWQRTDLAMLLGWSEAEFLAHTEGSPIRRIGHERWRRNLAVAAGNALGGVGAGARTQGLSQDAQNRLRAALQRVQAEAGAGPGSSPLVQAHVSWALDQTVEPKK